MGKELNDVFYFKDGRLYHKVNKASNKIKAGSLADTAVNNKGYRTCSFNGKRMKVHRAVYQMFKGEIPEGLQIDHINGDRLDNSPENLRAVTPQQNSWNRKKDPKVDRLPSGNFRAKLFKDGKHIGLGTYEDEELALLVAKEARETYFGEYA
jgi:hypothetical protein